MKNLSRRRFLKDSAVALGGVALSGFSDSSQLSRPSRQAPYLKDSTAINKVIVLGFDGMEPALVRKFVGEGALPTFKNLMDRWHFGSLQTTMPPQSPVAWSSFITGTNPGGHGIFDFIHRDPKLFSPYLSTSRSYPSKSNIKLGKWSLPIDGGRVESLRFGKPLWDLLSDNDIPSLFYRLPGDFPVRVGGWRSISGMGTPDVMGGYGTSHYFTEIPFPDAEKITSARIVVINLIDHLAKVTIRGPQNSFRQDKVYTEVDLLIKRDPSAPTIKLEVGGHTVILKEGEWSNWVPLDFEFFPLIASGSGIVRLDRKSTRLNSSH